MALQIRRGIESERTAVTFAEGELVYITDTDKLYIGDNTTVGGIEIGPKTLSELGAVSLSGNLTLGGNNITGTGNINITGDIQASGNITAGGNIDIGDAADDTLTISAKVDSSITPNADATYNLGSSALKWNNIHAVRLDGDVEGSVFGDDSSLLVDGVNNKVVLTNNTTTELSEGTNLYYTDVRADARITNAGSANWNTAFGWGNHASAGYQVAGAAIDGDIEGSVFGDDSTLLVDAVNNLIPATVISGTLANDTTGTAAIATAVDVNDESADTTCFPMFGTGATGTLTIKTDQSAYTYNANTGTLSSTAFSGNITGNAAGNHTGTFTGNVFTTLIDSADSSQIVVTPKLRLDSDLEVGNDILIPLAGAQIPAIEIKSSGTAIFDRIQAFTIGGAGSSGKVISSDILESIGDIRALAKVEAQGNVELFRVAGTTDPKLVLHTFTGDVDSDAEIADVSNYTTHFEVTSTLAKANIPVQFGSYTTTERNALTAANGQVVYNSTTNKFQGYAGGAWVDLH
tara:strand:+ start:6258 stop:7811 length:1554 start_codon:yes stop_codon:yes gene_type:complete